jgi:hypothetical protein
VWGMRQWLLLCYPGMSPYNSYRTGSSFPVETRVDYCPNIESHIKFYPRFNRNLFHTLKVSLCFEHVTPARAGLESIYLPLNLETVSLDALMHAMHIYMNFQVTVKYAPDLKKFAGLAAEQRDLSIPTLM